MIWIHNITTVIVSSKNKFKITAGPDGKQNENIDKNSGKISDLAGEGTESLKSHQEKDIACSLSLSAWIYIIDLQEV